MFFRMLTICNTVKNFELEESQSLLCAADKLKIFQNHRNDIIDSNRAFKIGKSTLCISICALIFDDFNIHDRFYI